MEEGNSDQNRDRKGKGKMENEIFLDKERSSKKNDSEGNQNVVHEGSSSSVQENVTAPVVLPDSIDPNKKNEGNQIFTHAGSSSSVQETRPPSRTHTNFRFPPLQPGEGTSSTSANQRSSSGRTPHQCRYCNLTFSDSMAFLFHEASHVAESHQYHKQRGYPPYDTLRPGYYTVPPITPRLTYTPHGYPEIELDMTDVDMTPIEWFQRFYHNFHYRSIYGEGGSSSMTGGFQRPNDFGNNSAVIDRASQRPRTNSSLSMTQTREQGRNDANIDLQLRVGTSSSFGNQDRDGGDHDHDHNNEDDDDGVYDPFSGVVWKPSK